jgi:hypothetical protein
MEAEKGAKDYKWCNDAEKQAKLIANRINKINAQSMK